MGDYFDVDDLINDYIDGCDEPPPPMEEQDIPEEYLAATVAPKSNTLNGTGSHTNNTPK